MNIFKIYLVVLYITYLLHIAASASMRKSGRYRSIIVRSERCAKPSRPYEKVPTATFYAEIYNTTRQRSLMRGNTTVLRKNSNIMLRFKGYYMVNNKWQLSFLINNVGCKGIAIEVLVTMLGITYDRRTCSIAKGTYAFENVDVNDLDHKWTNERQYGKVLWMSEAYWRGGVVACWETEHLYIPV